MIIDASIGVKWIVAEDDSELAVGLLDADHLTVPTLFFSEVGNALVKKARRNEIILDEVVDAFRTLDRLVTSSDERPHLPIALSLAAQLRHSIYDCVYLAMAIDQDTLLATADLKFAAKVATTSHASRLKLLKDCDDR